MNIEILKNGVVVNVIVADEAFAEEHYPGQWRAQESTDSPPISPPQNTKITKLAFRNRFTQAEKIAIEFASIDNPSTDTAARLQAAALRAYLKDVDSATFIDLTRQDLIDGTQALETMTLIASGRADQILTTPIEPHEVPQ